LPQIKVHDLPADPALYADSLLRSPWLGALTLTQEDRQRGRQYAARRAILESKSSYNDLSGFYASLGTELTLDGLRPDNRTRAGQLSVKTNQFNTTTRRYTEQTLDEIVAAGGRVAVIRSKDKYSESENIGLVVLKRNFPQNGDLYVDNYLLSCRALGRGIEVGLLQWLAACAKLKGYARLVGEVLRTERNKPASVVFQDAGFTPSTSDTTTDSPDSAWILDLGSPSVSDPAWLSIQDCAGIFE
jgi:FkbH-like protein